MAQDGDMSEYMSVDYWKKDWASKGGSGFHLNEVNGLLKKYLDRMTAGNSRQSFFYPFCGKDITMKWLADMGHTVVGVECAEQALDEFFTEQNVDYTTETRDGFTVYKRLISARRQTLRRNIKGYIKVHLSMDIAKVVEPQRHRKDEKLRMYCGNFYDFSSAFEGQFDIIWDRGGFNAVNKEEQTQYANLMMTLMKPDGEYYLLNFDMDEKVPNNRAKIGEKCNLELRAEFVSGTMYNGELCTGEDMEDMMEKLTIITLRK